MHKILSIALITISFNSILMALPIDMHGSFYADSTYISNYRGTKDNLGTTGGGSQEIALGQSSSALFQNYIFSLEPSIIVNDSVTIKGQLSNGSQGGFLGDDPSIALASTPTKSLYLNNSGSNDTLALQEGYAEVYSNTALYKIGRFAKHWGLGLIHNRGADNDDRFMTTMDGVEATFQFQKFSFTPYWARISAGSSQTADDDVRELGLSMLYADKDQDLVAGLHFSKRTAEYNSTFLGNNKVELKLYDLYIQKKWNNFELALEVPFVTGSFNNQDVEGMAAMVNTKLSLTKTWAISALVGYVSGQDDSSDVTAMGLNPNFQVAHLLLRYNYAGIEGPNSVFDANLSNVFVAKIAAEYMRGNWSVEMALIFAKAVETAESGLSAYNHSTGTAFTAAATQDDNLGTEFDITTKYQWYPNVQITAKLGYLALGDYYAFTNTATELDLKSPWTVSLGLGIDF